MLEAIRTTMRSRRACAVTGSAMTSRSRRSKSRGPPGARINGSPSSYPKRYANSPSPNARKGHPTALPPPYRKDFARRQGRSGRGRRTPGSRRARARPRRRGSKIGAPKRAHRRSRRFQIRIQEIQSVGRLFLTFFREPAARRCPPRPSRKIGVALQPNRTRDSSTKHMLRPRDCGTLVRMSILSF